MQCVGGFFAVATRGNCSFAQKVCFCTRHAFWGERHRDRDYASLQAYQAQKANYKGLLIYNYAGSNFPAEMGSDTEFGPRIRIPAFMVGYDCGWAIVHTYTYEKRSVFLFYVHLKILDVPVFFRFAFLIRVYWSYHDLLRYLVPFVVVVGICFFVMLSAMVVKCIRDKRREMRRRLTKRNLKQIPTKKFVKGSSLSSLWPEDIRTDRVCLV